jgi:hypothetical protein
MRFDVTGWPATMVTSGTVPATSAILVKNSCWYVDVGMALIVNEVAGIGIRG